MSTSTTSRILIEALAQTKDGARFDFEEIATQSRTTRKAVFSVLQATIPGLEQDHGRPTHRMRFQLAFQAAKNGRFLEAAEALTWQEFEDFTVECLELAGFNAIKGIIVHGHGRKWQIDLTGKKGSMLLVFDCKHWHSQYYHSKIDSAAKHQKAAVLAMLQDVRSRKIFPETKLWVLPIILTLLEPRDRLVEDAVIVSLEKLADFLNGVTPYASELPFIASDNLMESPIC